MTKEKWMSRRFMTCVFLFLLVGCATKHEVEVKPVEVKPIHITIDVNIRVDKALDSFFDDIDQAVQADEKPSKQ
jgi:hypothetical protein